MAPPLAVALDATPLLGRPTGVGAFCRGALGGLARRDDTDVRAFAVSWRQRHRLAPALPPGVADVGRAMPARPLQFAWARAEVPPVEWFIGHTDVVHGTNFVVPPARRAVRVVTVHDLTTVRFPELCDPPTLAFPRLVRRALRHGAWVHTPSQFVADEVVDLLGADPERVRAVHSGVPTADCSPSGAPGAPGVPGASPGEAGRRPSAATRLLPQGTTRFVLALGTAEPRKDLPGLVRAFGLLAPDRPDLALVLAGPEGWGADELAGAIAASPAAARVVRTGWVDDDVRRALVSEAAVLAYPSRYEGFGFPPLEAMAAGTPVVATRAGALPEVLGDGALLVPVGDAAALAGALASVLDDPATAAALAARGSARAAGYTWDRCADGLVALYRDARSAAGRGGSGAR